ncbi:MAG: uroporphyrinogen-III synthase [Lachnospiraceae bacterium]|nr:uroporphyrinogen-III synthase [Lachnospiraceae bacterium]
MKLRFIEEKGEKYVTYKTHCICRDVCSSYGSRGIYKDNASHRTVYGHVFPAVSVCTALGKSIITKVKNNEKVLLLRAGNASYVLDEILEAACIDYEDRRFYEMQPVKVQLKGKADYIVFASAKGVRSFLTADVRRHLKSFCA